MLGMGTELSETLDMGMVDWKSRTIDTCEEA